MRKVLLLGASILALGAGSAIAAESIIIDRGFSSTNTVDQSGASFGGPASSNSFSYIEQAAAGVKQGTVNVTQAVGAVSTSSVVQRGDNINPNAKVTQYGYGGVNTSSIHQGRSLSADSALNLSAEVFQSAGTNTANILQGSRDIAGSGAAQDANLSAVVSQAAGTNRADVFQDGRSNTFFVYQNAYSGGTNILTADQLGNNLYSANYQSNAGVGVNSIEVMQRGDSQYSYIAQGGTNNLADVMQTVANGNSSTIHQTGTNGISTVRQ